MMVRFVQLLCLIGASVSAKTSFVLKPAVQRSLEVRGGAGGSAAVLFDPYQTAKVATVLAGAQGLYGTLSVKECLQRYGLRTDSVTEFMSAEANAYLLNIAVLAYMQLYEGVNFERAVGYSCVPYIFLQIHKLLNNKLNSVGMPKASGYILLAVNCVVAWACVSDQEYSDGLIKCYAVWSVCNAALMLASPSSALKSWNVGRGTTAEREVVTSTYGSILAAHALMVGGQAWDYFDSVGAVGWGNFAIGIYIALGLVGLIESFDKAKVPKTPPALWLAFMSLVSVVILRN